MAGSPQPLKAVLAMRRITGRRVARLYGCSDTYVSAVLNGHLEPSPRFRAFVSELVGIAPDVLFYDDRSSESVPA